MPLYERVCVHVVGYWRPRKMIYANIPLLAIDIDNKEAEIVYENYWDYSALEVINDISSIFAGYIYLS